jgi:hypothetical protein
VLQVKLLHVQVLHAYPDDAVLAELRRHRRALCRAIGRPHLADAAGSMDPCALPLVAVALLMAGQVASQTAAAQLDVLQVSLMQHYGSRLLVARCPGQACPWKCSASASRPEECA